MVREVRDSLVGLSLCDLSPLIRLLNNEREDRSCGNGLNDPDLMVRKLWGVYCISEQLIMLL